MTSISRTPSDKAGRSIPAPGRGALTGAREVSTNHPLPLLDVAYRSCQLAFRRKQILDWLDHEHAELWAEVESLKSDGRQHDDYFASRVSDIEKERSSPSRSTHARPSSGYYLLAVVLNKPSRSCLSNPQSCKTQSPVERVSLLPCCPSPASP